MGGSLNWETFLVETNMFCFIHVGYLIQLKVFFSFWKKEVPSWNLENIFLLPWCMFNSQWNHHLSHAWLILWNLYPQQIWPVPMQSRQLPCRNHTLSGWLRFHVGTLLLTPPPKRPDCPNRCPKHHKFRSHCRFEIGTFLFVYLHLKNAQFFKISTVLGKSCLLVIFNIGQEEMNVPLPPQLFSLAISAAGNSQASPTLVCL